MQGFGLKIAPRIGASVHFGSHRDHHTERRVSVEDQLSRYNAGWQQLLKWDQTAHSVPVFQHVNLPKILESTRNFLERQARKRPSETLPFLMGLAGGSASGKTTIKQEWLNLFNRNAYRQIGWRKKTDGPIVSDIELDNYYKNNFARRKQMGDEAFFRKTNLDRPRALTLGAATRDVFRIKNGKVVRTPKIDFTNSARHESALYKAPTPFFFVEGLYALQHKVLRNLLDMKIFVATDAETRTQRWWHRAPERNTFDNAAGRALFNRTMQMHDKHVEPTREHADVVLNGAANRVDIQETLKQLTRLMLKTLSPRAIENQKSALN